MVHRCTNVDHKAYKDYGGRGITVCKEWIDDVGQFIRDMGKRPTSSHSLDRVDNDKGYEPKNCLWRTRKEQQLNRRNTIFYTKDGITKPLYEWATEMGLDFRVVTGRYHKGFDVDKLFSPITKRTRKCEKKVIPILLFWCSEC